MSEIVKRRIEAVEIVEAPPTPAVEYPSKPIESKTGNEAENEIKRLDIYEDEKGHKFSEDYFGFRELIAGDFKLKMDIAKIDKYIKAEMKEKEYDFTVDTYRSLLASMENSLKSNILNPRARLQKIINWISIIEKIKHAETLKKNILGIE
jgi:hypothetical protein